MNFASKHLHESQANKDRNSSQIPQKDLLAQPRDSRFTQGQQTEEQKRSDERSQPNSQLDEFTFFNPHELKDIYDRVHSRKINDCPEVHSENKDKQRSSAKIFEGPAFPSGLLMQTGQQAEQVEYSQLQIREQHLKHQLYSHVMKQELKRIKKKFRHFQIYPEEKSYQRLLLCFWLSIHLEKHIVVKFLYDRFDLIQQVVQVLYEQAQNNKEKIMREMTDNELYFLREKQPEALLINDSRFLDIEIESQYKTPEHLKQSTILPVTLGFLPHEIKEILRSRGELLRSQNQTQSEEISPFMSDQEEKQVKQKIKTIKRKKMEISIKEIKLLLMSQIGREFCNQVLAVALNDEEHRIALVVSIYYKVDIDYKCIYRSLCMKNIHFIKLLFTTELQMLLHREERRLSPMQVYHQDLNFKSLIQMIKTFQIECIDHAISDERTFSIIQKEKNAQAQSIAIDNFLKVIMIQWPLNQSARKNVLQTLLSLNLEEIAWQLDLYIKSLQSCH